MKSRYLYSEHTLLLALITHKNSATELNFIRRALNIFSDKILLNIFKIINIIILYRMYFSTSFIVD
jgi:hypothetical protein